ncbi:MAG TPA: hypothetical protein VHJ20_01350 [Polyangia bacterium]|nr:hypothetical protein [Polyangia bacterium]
MTNLRTCAALGLALATGGCSFKLVRPSPPRSEWPEPVTIHSSQAKCTSTVAPPVIDGTIAIGLGTLSYVERNARSQWFTPIAGLAAIPYALSAIYGAYMVERCRAYDDHFADVQPTQP